MNNTERYGIRTLAKNLEVPAYELALSPNMTIVGGSGSGKTTLLKPNLQHASQSIIISDTKGQLHKEFAQSFKDRGYSVYVLDFCNPYKSCGYNPLDYIRRYRDGSPYERDIAVVAKILMPDLDKREPIWEQSAISEIEMMIGYAMLALPKNEVNMISLAKLIRSYYSPLGKIEFEKWVKEFPDEFASRKYVEIKANEQADKMRASIAGFTNEALRIYQYKEAKKIFANPFNFNINILGRKKTVLFLNVSDTDRSYDHAVNLFYTQALQTLCQQADANENGRLKVPVQFIMDDFATSTKIPDFDKLVSVIRSRDISVSIIIQSISQLEHLYGKCACETILDNSGYILYLGGGQNSQSANFIAQRCNLTPEEVLCMPRTKVCVMKQGEIGRFYDKFMPNDFTMLESHECDELPF